MVIQIRDLNYEKQENFRFSRTHLDYKLRENKQGPWHIARIGLETSDTVLFFDEAICDLNEFRSIFAPTAIYTVYTQLLSYNFQNGDILR